MTYGETKDAGDIAVLADGTDAKCSIILDGTDEVYPLTRIDSQDGWFCFVWDRNNTDRNSPMWDYIQRNSFRELDVRGKGEKTFHGSIFFESYDADGSVLQQGSRTF